MFEKQPNSATYGFADFEVNLEDGTLIHRGYKVRLQDQPFRLLALLVSRAGTVVTRDEIQSHLWPENTFVEFDKSLRVAVSKLREGLRDSADQPLYIETIPRRGYRFIAAVTVLSPPVLSVSAAPPSRESDNADAQAAVQFPVSQPVFESSPAARPPLFPFRRVPLWIGFTAIFLAAASIYFGRVGLHRLQPQPVAAHPVVRRSVAVIGLRNLDGNSEDRWLSTALAEMLSSELSASDRLRVVSGEEVARAGLSDAPANTPSQESLARYARQLGADMIVFGSYTLSDQHGGAPGRQLRLDLRMENPTSEEPPVALVETGKASDLFALVSASGSGLRQRLGLGEMSADAQSAVRKSLPADPAAAQLYAEGLERLRVFDALHARDLLQSALRIEPAHAGTHSALAQAWSALGYETEARSEATRAVELASGLPRQDLLTMQGQLALFSHDPAHAVDIFRSLVTFYPDNIDYGLRLVSAQIKASLLDDTLVTIQNMRRPNLSPGEVARIDIAEARAHLALSNFQQCLAAADRAIQIGTELDQKLLRAQGLWIKASSLERMGKASESLTASSEAQSLYRAAGDKRGVGLALMMSGDVLYDAGKKTEARKSFQDALDLFHETGNHGDMGITVERIGNTYFDQGELPESRKAYQQALELYRESHNDGFIASAIGNIANVQDSEGNIAGALQSNVQGLDLFERTRDKRGTASTLVNMGNLELERGNLDQASTDFNRAVEIDHQIAYTRGVAYASIGQGDVLLARDDIPAATRQYDQALKAMNGMDEPNVLTAAHFSLGVAILLAGQAKQAQSDLQQAVDLTIKDGDHGAEAVSLAWLSRCRLDQGNAPDALTIANRAVTESHNQFSPQLRLIATLALARVQMAQGKAAAAQGELHASLLTAQHDGYAPLAMESRIMLARTESSAATRNHQLDSLAREASQNGWKRLAADARRTHM